MPSAHKGAISFGLVHIPIQLQVAVREHDLSFNQLCKKTGERIRYKKFCPSCNKEIKQDEIVKGYEYEKDKYVIISGDDLEKIQTEKDKTIQILKFVKEAEVDPIYFEKSSTDFLIIFSNLRKCRKGLEYQAFPAFCVLEDTPHIMAYRSLTWR